jgi:AsmA family protein
MTARAGNPAERHRGRRLLQLGGAVALLLVVALLEWQQWPLLRGPLERAATQLLGRELTLGSDFGLRLLGRVRLRTDRLVIAARPDDPVPPEARSRAPPVVDAHDLDLTVPYSTVTAALAGRNSPVRVARLDAERMDLNLVRNAEGRTNWQPPNDKRQDPQATRPALPVFERLNLRHGTVRLDDAALRLSVDATVRTREGDGAATPPAERASSAPASPDTPAGLEVIAQGRYRDMPMKLQLRTSGLLPLAAATGENGPMVPIELKLEAGRTRLTINGAGRSLRELAALDAGFDLQSPSLASVGEPLGVTLPTTSPFTTRGRLSKADGIWNVGVEDFSVGSSKLRGEFRYDSQREGSVADG